MRLSELCRALGLEEPAVDFELRKLAPLDEAGPEDLSFLDNPKYAHLLTATKAGAVLVAPAFVDKVPAGSAALVSDEPYLKLAEASCFFAPDPMSEEGADPVIGEGSRVAEGAYLGRDVVIGKNVTVMPGAYVGDRVRIGDETLIYPNVTIYHDCEIGKRCILHAGAVIGSDGFGFAHTRDGRHVKLYQLGRVVLEDEVEIGANTAIDRGTLSKTVIKEGTKVDNLVQIGHNCEVGPRAIVVSQVGLSGSTKLGRNVVMGGQSATSGHLEIGDFTQIAARGGVTKSLPGGKVFAGFPIMEHKAWLKLNAMLSRMLKSDRKERE